MRGRPLRWGEEAGWRHHGFARMPASDLGRAAGAIEAFFSLWDSDRRESAEVSEVINHRVLSANASRAHRLENGTIRHGLRFDVEMDPASFGSGGEAWLWGELLSRALGERESRLRFTELSWTVGDVREHFEAVTGRVWPGLFG
jgi:hypothetical protein